jgi:hypothetical protein
MEVGAALDHHAGHLDRANADIHKLAVEAEVTEARI